MESSEAMTDPITAQTELLEQCAECHLLRGANERIRELESMDDYKPDPDAVPAREAELRAKLAEAEEELHERRARAMCTNYYSDNDDNAHGGAMYCGQCHRLVQERLAEAEKKRDEALGYHAAWKACDEDNDKLRAEVERLRKQQWHTVQHNKSYAEGWEARKEEEREMMDEWLFMKRNLALAVEALEWYANKRCSIGHLVFKADEALAEIRTPVSAEAGQESGTVQHIQVGESRSAGCVSDPSVPIVPGNDRAHVSGGQSLPDSTIDGPHPGATSPYANCRTFEERRHVDRIAELKRLLREERKAHSKEHDVEDCDWCQHTDKVLGEDGDHGRNRTEVTGGE